MTKKIGMLRKKFLTRERLLLIVEYLCRQEKRKKWTPCMRREWDRFLADMEGNVDRLWYELRYRTYVPGPFNVFKKKEGQKMRVIYSSYPREQIVDQLLSDILEYVMTQRMKLIPSHCYGSIKGKGQHELRRIIIRKVKGKKGMKVLTADTAKYYPTMNHDYLELCIRSRVKDEWVVWLFMLTVGRMDGKGVALGLPSSNYIGHLNHLDTDWMMISEYGFRNYFRFCDDKYIVHTSSSYLHTGARVMRDMVERTGQHIKPDWRVTGCDEQYFECLGAIVNSHGARLKPYCRRRIERRMKTIAASEYIPFVAMKAWAGFKGSFDGLRVSNLIRFWKDRYPGFFRAVESDYALCRNVRKQNRLRRKRIKELAAAFGVERKEVRP